MNKSLFLIPVLLSIMGISPAFAESVNDVIITVVDYDGTSATVEATWNSDDITTFELGCVSCMPNFSETTFTSSLSLEGVTSLPNNSNAVLYLLGFDMEGELVHAEQILINLEQ